MEGKLKKITFSEFYEKYWIIKLPSGKIIKPTLTDEQRAIFDKADELNVSPYIRVWKRKYGWQYILHPEVEDAINKANLTNPENQV